MADGSKPQVEIEALLYIVRLLAAELVAGEHRHDVDTLVRAIDRKIGITPLPRGVDINDAREGFKNVRQLLRPVVEIIRSQAANARFEDATKNIQTSTKRMQ
jgi:hypothetical protein